MDSFGVFAVQSTLLLLLQASSGVLTLIPGLTEPEFIRRCVRAHNAHPSGTGARPMSWDRDLARGARERAGHCSASPHSGLMHFGHPVLGWMGENVWFGSPFSGFSVENAVQRWSREAAFSLKNNNCSSLCGHYGQLMWTTSFKLGCAVNVCTKGIKNFSTHPQSTIFVCNYGDTGQVHGVTPYIAGVSCSGCGSEFCKGNVCRYDWFPGWDAAPSAAARVSAQLSALGLCALALFTS